MSYLLDTCVLSELVKPVPDNAALAWLSERQSHELFVSTISLAELQRGVARLPESRRRSELNDWLQKTEAGFDDRVLSFDMETARVWASIMVGAERQGKPIPAFDSIIAAIALMHHLTLVTRNVRDFAASGVKVLNPWRID